MLEKDLRDDSLIQKGILSGLTDVQSGVESSEAQCCPSSATVVKGCGTPLVTGLAVLAVALVVALGAESTYAMQQSERIPQETNRIVSGQQFLDFDELDRNDQVIDDQQIVLRSDENQPVPILYGRDNKTTQGESGDSGEKIDQQKQQFQQIQVQQLLQLPQFKDQQSQVDIEKLRLQKQILELQLQLQQAQFLKDQQIVQKQENQLNNPTQSKLQNQQIIKQQVEQFPLPLVDQITASPPCVRMAGDKTVRCWDGVKAPSNLGPVKQIFDDGCAIKEDGTLQCWDSSYKKHPYFPVNLPRVDGFHGGYTHSCSILSGIRRPFCWYNRFDYDQQEEEGWIRKWILPTPSQLGPVSAVTAIEGSVFVIDEQSKKIRMWGYIDDANNKDQRNSILQTFSNLGRVSAISGFGKSFCAVLEGSNEVRCFEVKREVKSSRLNIQPTAIPVNLGPVKELSVSPSNTCILNWEGSPVCWGKTQELRTLPISIKDAKSISVGSDYTCLILENGYPFCWGVEVASYIPKDLRNPSLEGYYQQQMAFDFQEKQRKQQEKRFLEIQKQLQQNGGQQQKANNGSVLDDAKGIAKDVLKKKLEEEALKEASNCCKIF